MGVAGIALVIALFVALGIWQLRRADEKRALAATAAASARLAVMDLPALGTTAGDLVWQRVRVHGRWLPSLQVLLDNQVVDREPGYDVLTPLRADSGTVLLVNRGWVPAGADRSVLPDVRLEAATVEVRGMLAPPPNPAVRIGKAEEVAPGLLRTGYIDTRALGKRLGVPLLDATLRLDPDLPDGFRRKWRPPGLSPERHVAYAVQWFLLAVVVLIGAIWRYRSRGGPGRADQSNDSVV